MRRVNLFFIPLIAIACNNSQNENNTIVNDSTQTNAIETPKEVFNELDRLSEEEKDTLLTNLATYIYRKPAVATWETKFDLVFRSYFIENRTNLELIYLHQTDSNYYYYLLRDARDKNGLQKRGVGGKFLMDESLTISNFEELFNTPIHPEDKLKEIGKILMDEMLLAGNVNKFLSNPEFIEWPDGSLFYSKEKHEWRYVD